MISTIHISRPDEALHLSPAVNSPLRPPRLTVPSQNKQEEPCIQKEKEGSFHYAPSLWFQQLICTRRASLGLFSGLLCGQTSGLAVIALWVKAQIDHTGLVVVRPNTSQ